MLKKKVIVIGTGWGSATFIKNINTNIYDVSVISLTNNFTYTPLLENNIKENINLDIDIKTLNNISFNKDKVVDINFKENKLITLNNKFEYDYLVLSHGTEINTFGINGVIENCNIIKSTEDIDKIRNTLQQMSYGSKIAIIGCSLTGSEIIGTLIDYNKFNIYAIDGLDRPLSTFNNIISDYTLNIWNKFNVNIFLNSFVNKIDKEKIYLNSENINYDMVIWCGGIKTSPLSIHINTLLNLDCKRGIPIDGNLKVLKTNNVYAIGDCSYSDCSATAQVASQHGKYLANYFNNNLKGNNFKYNYKGQICYVGNGCSVYQYNRFYLKGKLTGYFNSIIHLYNSINYKQSLNILLKKLH